MAKKNHYSNGFLLSHIELTKKQQEFFKILTDSKSRIIFLEGPAGSSKTFLAIYAALYLCNKDSDLRILYLRSAIESAQRSLGYLKGDLDDKFSVYMAPLMDKIDELLNEPEKIMLQQKGIVSAEPINFLRGQSWRDKIVIQDECQNNTSKELITSLTRIGKNSKLIMCGDVMQSDIKNSGFKKFCDVFDDQESRDIGIYRLSFTKEDIMRDPIITYLIEKIEKMCN